MYYNDYKFSSEIPDFVKNNKNTESVLKKIQNINLEKRSEKTWFSKVKSFFSWSFFKDFCNETSIHGFNHIVAPRRHFLEKLGWFAATVIAAIGALQLCLEQWQRFVASPTVVALEKDYRNWNNTFMALTACQQLKYTKDPEGFIKKTWGVSPGDEKYEHYLSYVKIVANATLLNMESFEPFKNDETLKNINMFEIATQVITPLKPLVLWYDKIINVSFVNVMTEIGICHTINSVVSVDQAIILSGNKITMANKIVQCSYLTHPCYLRVEITEKCMSYYVHSPYDAVDILTGLVKKLCKGQDANTDWGVIETKSSKEVRDLRIEQRKCRYYNEPEDTGLIYSVSSCRRKCRNRIALKLCGCRPFFYFQEGGEMCDAAGMACLGNNIESLLQPENCECQAQCEEASYEMYFIKESFWTGPLGMRNSMKVGLISPRSRYKRQILFCFEDLVVSFGGAAGLFLGCSFLSGVEIVYFIIERLVKLSGKLFCKKFIKKSTKNERNKLTNANNNHLTVPNSNEVIQPYEKLNENLKKNIMSKFVKKIAVYDRNP